LLTQAKSGREIHYYFNGAKMKELDQWLAQFKKHWEDRFSQLDQVLINLNLNNNEN
jgi:arsenate reductase-like glutaredoxin family protein